MFCDGSNKVILEASAGKDLLGNYIVQQIICDYFKKTKMKHRSPIDSIMFLNINFNILVSLSYHKMLT